MSSCLCCGFLNVGVALVGQETTEPHLQPSLRDPGWGEGFAGAGRHQDRQTGNQEEAGSQHHRQTGVVVSLQSFILSSHYKTGTSEQQTNIEKYQGGQDW